jgi:hypothetical protein
VQVDDPWDPLRPIGNGHYRRHGEHAAAMQLPDRCRPRGLAVDHANNVLTY